MWEEHELYGLVVEPADRAEQTKATMQTLRTATTWGEIRSADLAPWTETLVEVLTESWVEQAADDYEDEHDEYPEDLAALEPTDDDPWTFDSDAAEMATDRVPLPWDAESTREWLSRDLLAAHAEISGASPFGHSDGYEVHDRDAFLAALGAAGFEPVHRPGFLDDLLKNI